MIDRVTANIRPLDPTGEIVVATQSLVGETRGAVDTVLKATDKISLYHAPLVVANCDQLIQIPQPLRMKGDGVIFTFRSANPAHSYVATDSDDRIHSIREKVVISDRAVSGVYWFKDPGPFLDACTDVLETRGDRELYISEAIAEMLDWGVYDLYAVDVPTAILGTPEDFSRFQVALSMASAA